MDKNDDFKGGQISKIIIDSLKPFLEKIKKVGLKKSMSALFPGKDADAFVLKKIKNQLAKKRAIELGKNLGRLEVQYRFDGIQIEPCGILRFLIKHIINSMIIYGVSLLLKVRININHINAWMKKTDMHCARYLGQSTILSFLHTENIFQYD